MPNFWALKQGSKLFGIGSAGMRTKMRRSSSIIIMNMVTSNKKIQKKAVAVTDDNLKT